MGTEERVSKVEIGLQQQTVQTKTMTSLTGAKLIDRESNMNTRWIKEATWIKNTNPVMNRNKGDYRLGHIWDGVLAMPSGEQEKNCKNSVPDEGYRQ